MSAFQGLNNVAVVGREIRSWAERPLKRGVRISEVRISEAPLYNKALPVNFMANYQEEMTLEPIEANSQHFHRI